MAGGVERECSDQGVGVHAADERDVHHAGEREIIHVAAAPGEEPRIVRSR
jgi:hypothetical protein